MSVATTCAPARAANTATSPSPAPISSTRSPADTERFRHKNSDPALGGCTPYPTRNTHPRQVNSSRPGSSALPAKDFPEVEAQRLLELGARARLGLGVLELIDVDLERHAFFLDAVQLGGEPAPLVRFREHDLGAGERRVVARDLLHGLDDHPLDRLRLLRRHRRKRRRETHLSQFVLHGGPEMAPKPPTFAAP